MASSSIEWTDETWNPVTGCDRTSPGCDNCYALTLAGRLKGMRQPKYQRDGNPRTSGPGFGVTLHHSELEAPLHWRKPRMVFVNSMSDLFHPDVPDGFILGVFGVMAQAEQHTFQVLTKRPQRMAKLLEWARREISWLSAPLRNVWLGTSVENQRYAHLRIPYLLATPAAVRFLSAEPLLGPVDLSEHLRSIHANDLDVGHYALERNSDARHVHRPSIDWVIVGGESGKRARPMDTAWVATMIEQCRSADVAMFVKQLGSVWAAEHTGRRSHGSDWDAWPDELRVRAYPGAVSVAG